MSEKVIIFGKKYNKRDLKRIVKEDNDPILEHIGGRLEYICDCSSVRFFEEYGETFRNKETGEEVEICMRYYPDDGSYEFARGQDSVYYIRKKL